MRTSASAAKTHAKQADPGFEPAAPLREDAGLCVAGGRCTVALCHKIQLINDSRLHAGLLCVSSKQLLVAFFFGRLSSLLSYMRNLPIPTVHWKISQFSFWSLESPRNKRSSLRYTLRNMEHYSRAFHSTSRSKSRPLPLITPLRCLPGQVSPFVPLPICCAKQHAGSYQHQTWHETTFHLHPPRCWIRGLPCSSV